MKQNTQSAYLIILAAMFAVLCSVNRTHAGCYCMMHNMDISADYAKSGFQGCTTNVIAEWNLQSTEVYTVTGSGAESYPAYDGISFQVSVKKTTVQTFNLADLPGTYNGGTTSDGCAEFHLPWTETINISDNGNTSDHDGFSYWSKSETTVEDSSGDYTDSISGTLAWWNGEEVETAAATNPPEGFPNPGINPLPQTFSTNYCIDDFSEIIYVDSSTDANGSESETYDTQTTYSMPFTDEMLRGCIMTLMPSWPTNWSGGTGYAFYTLSQGHGCGSGGQMKYQLLVPDSKAHTLYTLQWQEVTMYPDTTNVTSTTLEEGVPGTGDPVNPAPGIIHFVPMPKSPSTIYETAPTVIRVTSDGSGGGGGPPPAGSGGSAGGTSS
jgi:hypothetical protein